MECLDRAAMAGVVGTSRLAHIRIVSRKSGMQPPQSARFPSAWYILPGVMMVSGSARRIHSTAARMS